jgi:hypothetical protein
MVFVLLSLLCTDMWVSENECLVCLRDTSKQQTSADLKKKWGQNPGLSGVYFHNFNFYSTFNFIMVS